MNAGQTSWMMSGNMSFLDSPNSTSAITYKVQVQAQGAGTAYINRTQTDTNSLSFARGSSTITVMEILG